MATMESVPTMNGFRRPSIGATNVYSGELVVLDIGLSGTISLLRM